MNGKVRCELRLFDFIVGVFIVIKFIVFKCGYNLIDTINVIVVIIRSVVKINGVDNRLYFM